MYSLPPPPQHQPQPEAAPATGVPIPNQQFPTQTYMQPGATTAKVPWSTGLFDCFLDVPNCCITCCCPCITFGQIAEIIDEGTPSCQLSAALYTLLNYVTGCGWICSYGYRSRMKHQYMLEDSPYTDCCVIFCCEHCALCQEYRELRIRGFDMSLGWHGNMQRQQILGMPTAPVVESGMKR